MLVKSMKKSIVIRNEKDLKKFMRLLFVYRSFLYRFVHFEISSKKYDVSSIVNALNIKNRKKRIIYIFDAACKTIDNYFADKDYCRFKDGKCLSHRENKVEKVNGCCRMCQYRTGKACPTRNIACKLFYCSSVRKNNDILLFEDVEILKVLSYFQRLILKSDYFSLERDVILDLYYGPLIAPFRIVYRFIRYFFFLKLRK